MSLKQSTLKILKLSCFLFLVSLLIFRKFLAKSPTVFRQFCSDINYDLSSRFALALGIVIITYEQFDHIFCLGQKSSQVQPILAT